MPPASHLAFLGFLSCNEAAVTRGAAGSFLPPASLDHDNYENATDNRETPEAAVRKDECKQTNGGRLKGFY